jgi:hypothetical protein
MRIHQNQVNPNVQLDAMYVAQKAAAKQEVERMRKKLTEFASELASETEEEACIVQLGPHEESGEDGPRQRQDREQNRKLADDPENSISDWA